MYLYPNRFGNSYTNQVTGPWMDTTFSNYPTVDIDTLLLNNTEGMLKSSLVNAWQYMNIDKVSHVSVFPVVYSCLALLLTLGINFLFGRSRSRYTMR